MKIYACDVRHWFFQTIGWILAFTVGATIGFFITNGSAAGILIAGLAWMAFTRIYLYITRRTVESPDDRESRKLWHEMRRIIGRYDEGDRLVVEDTKTLFFVLRRGNRGVQRTRRQDLDPPRTDFERGTLLVEYFTVSSPGIVLRVTDAWIINRGEDGEIAVRSSQPAPPTTRSQRRESRRLAQKTGINEVDLNDLRELVAELRRARVSDR